MSSFCTALTFFQHICVSLYVNFNESLTNDIVSFEELGQDCYSLELPLQGSSNEQLQHVLWRNTDTYAFMLIHHKMPTLAASLDQIQKIGKIDSIL